MLVVKMILRVTGLNQEELANYLGVSRQSINSWVNSNEEMTTYQKNIISQKFKIPIEYLNIDLNQDIEVYKKLYSIIDVYWNKYNNTNNLSKEDEIINLVEYQLKGNTHNMEISNKEIIDALSDGYNPFTGEVFNEDHILNNIQIKDFLITIKNKYYKHGINKTKDDLTIKESDLFEILRKWRIEKMIENEYFNAYIVFTDKELINIVTASINKKDDLLNIKGIGKVKYEKYGEELFNIIKKYNNKV